MRSSEVTAAQGQEAVPTWTGVTMGSSCQPFTPHACVTELSIPLSLTRLKSDSPFRLGSQGLGLSSALTLPRDVVAMSQQKESWKQLCHSQAGWAENWLGGELVQTGAEQVDE